MFCTSSRQGTSQDALRSPERYLAPLDLTFHRDLIYLYQGVRRHGSNVDTTAGFSAELLAWRRGRWRLGAANERRQGDAEDPEHGGGATGAGVAQDVALAACSISVSLRRSRSCTMSAHSQPSPVA